MTTIDKGTRCVACLGGPWIASTITRCNEDGTFNLVPIGHEDDFLSLWEGVTRAELSIDDEAVWPAVFDRLRGARAGIGLDEVRIACEHLGMDVDPDRLKDYWGRKCGEIVPGRAPDDLLLDRDDAYRFFVGAGYSARLLADPAADPSRDLFKLYWNQIRMGGRDPSDVARPIAIADTLVALDLEDAAEDPERVAALAGFAAAHGVTLPATLTRLWATANAPDAILDSHCNNPEPLDADAWELRRGDASAPWGERLALRIMSPHQGDHAWWAVFADGAGDAEVWLSFEEDGPPVRRVAASVAFFFWDLAETGRCWEMAEAEQDREDEAEGEADDD